MASSTTRRLAAIAMQMPHWSAVSPVGPEDPLEEVDGGDRHDGEQRDAVPAQLGDRRDRVPVEDRVQLVAGQQARHHVEQRQRGEQHGGGDHRRRPGRSPIW